MSPRTESPEVDPGLLARFRAAGAKIVWRPAPARGKGRSARTARIAHLHDEETRVEVWGRPAAAHVAVDSGPLGALVLLIEIDARGPPSSLGARESGRDPSFPGGVIEACWGGGTAPFDARPTVPDLVEIARYALA